MQANIHDSTEIVDQNDLDSATLSLSEVLRNALDAACPLIYTINSFKKLWYTRELDDMRKNVWSANLELDEAVKYRFDPQLIDDLRATYNGLRNDYDFNCEKAKQESFEAFASEIESIGEVARLTNVSKRVEVDQYSNITMKLNNGVFTADASETLDALVGHHFPSIYSNISTLQNQHSVTEAEKKCHRKDG